MTTTLAAYKKEAVTFYWRWLIGSSVVSIVGNVTHALFNSHNNNAWVAACMALVPPVVLALATHGLSLMVRTQIEGMFFRVALGLTAAIAVVALVLSFVALFELAVQQGGMNAWVAWLWPLVVDLSVAFSTIALLALTIGKRARREAAAAVRPARKRAPAKPKAQVKAIKGEVAA
ncbi:membrane protein [Mycobacterium phage Skinny]|uniref:Membrane protein n=2 Tax=Bongovirus bongo TaxID=1983750 RepID=A0A514DJ74_9CAUD|nr:hypothetical protein PEGLEG_136 [Mycobacterium phage PegLeg]QDH93689.1 membrane protein [Mycobacterium phage LilhomieP]QUU29317.1 hypothetical protein [Mycobacterium phage SirSheldon]UXE05310.1 membrane protein [Mycobacterium phage Skinny]WMI33293.1 hypothetical protein SEA_SLIMJIMMY_132 [Mycobacterium phage SlimJimmy]WNN95692.1 membrane protein [Mycobacterium phage Glaske16]WNN96262.1 membrane protein [Mycobacterium phage Dulcita]WNO28206.1 membrane protein [Mycobacterium phage Diminimus